MRIGIVPHLTARPKAKNEGYSYRLYLLAEELIKRGHEVAFLCPLKPIGSKAKHIQTLKKIEKKNWEIEMLNIAKALEYSSEFDIINFQTDHLAVPFSNLVKTPLAHTIIYAHLSPEVQSILKECKKQNFIAISKNIKQSYNFLNFVGIAHNGLDPKDFKFSAKPGKYLLCISRLDYEKGPHIAIDIAEKLKMKLILAGGFRKDNYYNEYIAPRLKDAKYTTYIGKASFAKKNILYKNAIAFLHPVLHNEGFGNTMIESMACGTPVIAFKRGSVPEVVEDKKTGFVVKDEQEMIEAIKKINTIKREDCRKRVEKYFSAEAMADNYEKLFYKILNKKK